MADTRYGYARQGWRERESSIFSEDDRSGRGFGRRSPDRGGEHGRGYGRDDEAGLGRDYERRGRGERGFLDRAGDEVRSWFGDEEAERRREMDMSGEGESRGGRSSAELGWRSNHGQGGYERGYGRTGGSQAGYGALSSGRDESRSGFGGRASRYDENYLRWRDRQIAEMDREYEEYCRDCQDRFGHDFSSWRSSRERQGRSGEGDMGQSGAGTSGGGLIGSGSRYDAGERMRGAETGAATTTAAGSGSATDSSTGSTGAARESSARGRGRSRTP